MGLFDFPGSAVVHKHDVDDKGLQRFTMAVQIIHGDRSEEDTRYVSAEGASIFVSAPTLEQAISGLLGRTRDDFEAEFPDRLVKEVGILAVYEGHMTNLAPKDEDACYVSYEENEEDTDDEAETDTP